MSNIDNKWFKDKRRIAFIFAVPLFLLIAAIILSVCYSKDNTEVIMPPEENGFIGKSNQMLSLLLTDSQYIDNSVRTVKTIGELNNKYKALEFAMPYGNDALAMREDIRLVKIHADLIKDEGIRNFYFNSYLPSLLSKQSRDLGEKMFKIQTKRSKSGLEIKSIEIIRSMFKVALSKDPWTGSIKATNNSLFEQDSCLFLSYESSIVPLRIFNNIPANNHYFTIDINTDNHRLTCHGEPLDYYRYYRNAHQMSRFNNFTIRSAQLSNRRADFFIKCYSGSGTTKLQLRLNNGLSCSVFSNGQPRQEILPSNHEASAWQEIPFRDGMKILLHAASSNTTLAEFTITKEDPSLLLSSLVKSNAGKKRTYTTQNTDMFTQQILRGLSSNLSNTIYPEDISLTIDPLLSKEFERELSEYLDELNRTITAQRQQRWDISLTIMDMATGHILATPFVTRGNGQLSEKIVLTRKNPALERRYIGSVFKPMLTLAAVQNNPSLLHLNTRNKLVATSIGEKGCEEGVFLGSPTKGWAPASHWNGCDMTNFIAHSDDVYPVALATLCLNNYDDNSDLNLITNIQRNFGGDSFFERQLSKGIQIGDRSASGFEFFSLLDALYHINSYDESDADTVLMANYLWKNIHLKERDYFGLSEVSPEPTVMLYDYMTGSGQTLRGELVPWVLGQGNNYWNCIKLAEAWGRMLSKRAISASFVIDKEEKDSVTPSLVPLVRDIKLRYNNRWDENRVNTAWNDFLTTFNTAQSLETQGSTLRPMYQRVEALNRHLGYNNDDRRHLVLFSKTGTPEEYSYRLPTIEGKRNFVDLGLYCMGIMSSQSLRNVRNNRPASGIICVIRITRQYPKSTNDSGIWSTHARDFFTNDRLEKLYYLTRKHLE